MVIFACELIPAMGAPAASVDLLHETCEKAADAHKTASSIWDILNYFALSLWWITPPQSHTRGRFRHIATKIAAGAPIAGISSQCKDHHGEAQKFKIDEQKLI
jgi:hypothetical protein